MIQVRLDKPELQQFIDEQVSAGHFPSRQAVIEDALARMMEQEVELTADDLSAIGESDAQIEAGQTVPFAEFAARMKQRHGIRP